MLKGYLVSVPTPEGSRNIATVYPSVEEALRGAGDLLNEGVEAVHIVDNEGNLILPPDQVHLRLNPPAPIAKAERAIAELRSFPIRKSYDKPVAIVVVGSAGGQETSTD